MEVKKIKKLRRLVNKPDNVKTRIQTNALIAITEKVLRTISSSTKIKTVKQKLRYASILFAVINNVIFAYFLSPELAKTTYSIIAKNGKFTEKLIQIQIDLTLIKKC